MPRGGKGSSKAERDALRQEMLVSGCSLELIATEMERRFAIRPREAYRHAHGWSQDEVAARFTEVADRIGGDRSPGPDGRPVPPQAPMIGTRIGEYERWPNGGRRPSPYVLTVLATVLGTTVERLLDYDDHRKMPDQERTVLAAVLAAASAPVALSPGPRPAPGPSRAPLGRLTELLTSADQNGPDGAEEDRAGRAGALTAEQWSAARRLVERGFGPAEDGSAEPAEDPAGPAAAPPDGKKRGPIGRARPGGQRRVVRDPDPLGPDPAGMAESQPDYARALDQLRAAALSGTAEQSGPANQTGTAKKIGSVEEVGAAGEVGAAEDTGAAYRDGASKEAGAVGEAGAIDEADAIDEVGAANRSGTANQPRTANHPNEASRSGTANWPGPANQPSTTRPGTTNQPSKPGTADRPGTTNQPSTARPSTARPGTTNQPTTASRSGTADRPGPVNQPGTTGPGTTRPGTANQPTTARPGSTDQPSTAGPGAADERDVTAGAASETGPADEVAPDAAFVGSATAEGQARTVRTADTTPRIGLPGQRVRRGSSGGAVILPFSSEEPEEPEEPEDPEEPEENERPEEPEEPQQPQQPEDPEEDEPAETRATFHDDPPNQPRWSAQPGHPYGPGRLQQRVPRPVPPPLPDPPYIAVTLDQTSPDAAAAARRHRRDRLLATEIHGTGVRSDEEVIMDAASQSAEFSEWAEGTNVGSTTLEQLDEDVRRISRDYLGNPPLPLLLGALRVRNRVFTLLEGRQHPEQTRQLYLGAGRLCGLLGWMASDLGRHGEAETQARTAWLCAELAGSDGLRAWVRATQSKIAYWDGRIQESAGLASDGLRFEAPDSARVLLASLSARAWARLGHKDEAHSALHVAEDERARAGEDEVGGLLGFSEAQQSYMAGTTYLWLQEPKEALAASDRAIWLFDVGSASNRFYGAEMLALVDAATALVQSGDIDGAAERLRPVLELPPEQQLDTFTSRLGELRESLRRSRYAASQPAVEIQRQIEEFRAGALGQILGR